MILIGIAGAKQSGKSTAAEIITELTQEVFVTAYAEPLKIEVFDVIHGRLEAPRWIRDLIPESLRGLTFEEEDRVYWHKIRWINSRKADLRQLLQVYGTEYRRAQDDLYWIKKMAKLMDSIQADSRRIQSPEFIFAITDVRFDNEAQLVRDRGGHLIRINRGQPSGDPHASERRLDLPDAVEIDNNGSMDDLRLAVRAYLIGLGVEVRWDGGHAERMVEEFNKEAQ
jgi:hypothetical protein